MFDLDKALAAWRRSMENNRAFTADDLDELEQHLRDQIGALTKEGRPPKGAFDQAVREMGDFGTAETEYRKVFWGKRRRRGEVLHELEWRLSMLRNYLKVALRNVGRHPGNTVINVVGLAVGMTCCLLITLYVQEELSYDRHHPNHERLYRVALEIATPSATRVFADGPPTLGRALKEDYPQVEEAVRLWALRGMLVRRGPERRFYEDHFFFADPSVFDVFDLPLTYGTAETALTQPETVVLSARMAAKYFDEENPVGQTLTIDDTDYKVTGVLREVHENSHVTFDFISSILPVEQKNAWFENWHLTMFHTYVRLRRDADVESFSAELSTLAERYVGDDLDRFDSQYHYFLQPISQVHLHSDLRGEIEPPGNALYIYVFSVVAVLILLIASLNYINLTTAQSATRAKEVSVRKVVGSGRHQLFWQFLSESMTIAIAALILALALAIPAFTWFNTFTAYRLGFAEIFQPRVLIGLTMLVLFTGGLAGFIPAFALSSMQPLRVRSARFRSSGRSLLLRKTLVTVQFAISLILIVGSIAAFRQLEFMKQNSLGFDEEQMLVLPIRDTLTSESHDQIRAEWLRDPAVYGATASSFVPGRGVDNFSIELMGEADRKNQSMNYLFVDFDFVSTYGIEMVAGRSLQQDVITDREGAFLMNEAGLRAFGWQAPDEALGRRVQTGFGGRHGEIVGVFRNFNYRSLHADVEPLMLTIAPARFRYLTLKVDAGDLSQTLARIERSWQRLVPDRPFEYFFLDEDFDRQYRADEKTALLMLVFAGLAILIACLGLLGLAAYSAQTYTKEIGIRKVLGASVGSIVALLTRDFARLVLLAVVIGTPLAWFAVNRWLNTFAYRVDVSVWIFVLAGLTALSIALLTVSYQAVAAALADPVKSLRYE